MICAVRIGLSRPLLLALVLATLLFAPVAPVAGVTPPTRPHYPQEGRLLGHVTDAASKAGLASAHLLVVAVSHHRWMWAGQTTWHGYYVMHLPTGHYTLTARQTGYGPASRKVIIQSGKDTVLHLALQPEPIPAGALGGSAPKSSAPNPPNPTFSRGGASSAGAATSPVPVPLPPTVITLSGAITATSGQVIRGVRITSTSGPCITIDNVANVWVDNVELGPCAGNGVRITGAGATGIRITNSLIHTERAGPADSGVGVYFWGVSNLLVQGNQFSYNESSVYGQGSNIRVVGNYSLNPLGPFPRGQHVQFNNVVGGEISDNYGESRTTGVTYQSQQEDAISVFQSSNISVLRNYLVGGLSASGCGIILEAGGSDNLIADNTVIRTAQCGIGVATTVNGTVRNNKVLDTNIPGPAGNIGIYVWNIYHGACSGITVQNNIVSNRHPSGVYNDYWDAGNCGPVIFNGNTLGDVARVLLVPEAIMLPRPAIPPRPY